MRVYLQIFLTCCFMLILTSCGYDEPLTCDEEIKNNKFLEKYIDIDPERINQIQEIHAFDGSQYDSVTALHFQPSNNSILVAYGESGILRSYDLQLELTQSEMDLGIIGGEGAVFNRCGTYILSPTRTFSDVSSFPGKDFIGGIGLWDTRTGKLLKCYDPPCKGMEKLFSSYIGIDLHPTSDSVILYSDLVFSVNTGLEKTYTEIETVNSPDSKEKDIIGKIIFDQHGNRIATAFESGIIEINGFPRKILDAKPSNNVHVVDLVFSEDGKLIATIMDETVMVWKIGLLRSEMIVKEEVQNAKSLAFNSKSSLLFVGTQNQIISYDLNSRSQIAHLDTPNLTTFIIGPNDQFLIWGDIDGTTHVMACSRI